MAKIERAAGFDGSVSVSGVNGYELDDSNPVVDTDNAEAIAHAESLPDVLVVNTAEHKPQPELSKVSF